MKIFSDEPTITEREKNDWINKHWTKMFVMSWLLQILKVLLIRQTPDQTFQSWADYYRYEKYCSFDNHWRKSIGDELTITELESFTQWPVRRKQFLWWANYHRYDNISLSGNHSSFAIHPCRNPREKYSLSEYLLAGQYWQYSPTCR